MHAGVLIEPYAGLNFADNFNVNGVDYKHNNVPLSIGARAGFSNLGVAAGLDVQKTYGVKLKNQGNKFDAGDIGLFLAYKFPVLLRVYAAYIFSTDFKASGAIYDEGSGTKLGVGFTGFPLINVNLEYKKTGYDKLNGNTVNADFSTYLISVSLPLTF